MTYACTVYAREMDPFTQARQVFTRPPDAVGMTLCEELR